MIIDGVIDIEGRQKGYNMQMKRIIEIENSEMQTRIIKRYSKAIFL